MPSEGTLTLNRFLFEPAAPCRVIVDSEMEHVATTTCFAGGATAGGVTLGFSTSTVFEACVTLPPLIDAVFLYGFSSPSARVCSHENVSDSPAARVASPAGRIPEHFASFN